MNFRLQGFDFVSERVTSLERSKKALQGLHLRVERAYPLINERYFLRKDNGCTGLKRTKGRFKLTKTPISVSVNGVQDRYRT